MSLQLIVGGSGSGKSYELYKNVIEASVLSPGTQFLVIVPEQFTMQTQKDLVSLHPNKGILNIDILSFQRLAHRIFEEVGADQRTVLEEVGKTLLLRRAAGKHQDELKVLKRNLKKRGYLAEVKSVISEFTQYDIDDDKMGKMLSAVNEKPQLYYKLQDLKVLYKGFQEEMQGKYITAEETLEALCQVADTSGILKNCVIALDGFTGFTPIQQKLLKKLMVLAKEVYVTVTIDAHADLYRIFGEHELFYLSKKTIHSLTAMAAEVGCEILEPKKTGMTKYPRFHQAEELSYLEKGIFRKVPKQLWEEKPSDISMHALKNPVSEIRFVARNIRNLVQQGYRYQDMAMIVGNMEAYENHIPYIFKEYQIPVFMDYTRSAVSNPFIEWIRALLEMIEEDYTRESVFRYLRTGLCHMEDGEIDDLENYCLAAGIRGRKHWQESFFRQPAGYQEEDLMRLEELRKRIMDPIIQVHKVMKEKSTTEEKTRVLYELIEATQMQTQLYKMELWFEKEGLADRKKEYAQIYRMVIELFDKLVELLGKEVLSLQEYREILDTGFEEMKIGIIPPSADLVQVGNIERTRLKDIKVLFFMGLNDGYVPANKAGGGLLSDMEREALKTSDVELAPTARQDSYIQKFYLYLNLTKPSERLYLTYSKANQNGEPMRPSYVLHSLEKLFPEIKVKDEEQHDSILEKAVTPEAAKHELVRYMTDLRIKEPETAWVELYNWYRRQDEYKEKIELLLEAVFKVFTEDKIGKAAAKALYGEVLENSVSRLERFAGCAFSHFLEYGLRLKEREEYSFQPTDLGTIVHKIVELFTREVDRQGYDWNTLQDSERNQLIDKCVEVVTEDYGQSILHSNHRNEHVIERIKRIMRRTAWALQKQLQAGTFLPAEMEVAFTQAKELDAVNIRLSDDEKMRLQGRIDRIDLCEKGEELYVKVIDYKSGKKTFDLVELYHGLQLQLVVYLNAAIELEKRKHPDKEIVPAGIFYYRIDDPMLNVDTVLSSDVINEKILKELKLNGLVNEDPEVFREMDGVFETESFIIPVGFTKDGKFSKNSKTATKEQFRVLSDYVNEKLRELGSEIMKGTIAAVPYEKGDRSGCDYCAYKEICRWDRNLPGTHTKRLREYSAEEIWERMEITDYGNTMDERTE